MPDGQAESQGPDPGIANPERIPRVVIVGAGFGGLSAARALKRARASVTVIDRRNHHLFQPLLYQVATAGLSPANIAYPIRSVLGGRNVQVLLDEVTSLDLEAREVATTHGPISYDFLILAPGADTSYFGHDEWAPNAPGLKSLDDALEIRRRILFAFELAERETEPQARHALLTFVVIGGGPTGVEMAGAISEISRKVIVSDFHRIDPREARIVLIEAGPRILPAFDESLADKARHELERFGVEVMVNTPVQAVEPGMVRTAGGTIEARTVVWAAGIRASGLARLLGVELDRAGRVKVEPDLSVPGHPELFVVGDLAACMDEKGVALPGLAPVAIQEGRHAARNIERTLEGKARIPFHYVDKGTMATVGRAFAVAEIAGFKLSGFIAWVVWSLVHIAYLIGFRNRMIVMFEWAWAYLTYQRGARLITGSLHDLLAAPESRESAEPAPGQEQLRR